MIPNYAICIPYYGPFNPKHRDCVVDLTYNHGFKGKVFELRGCPYIDMGRAALAAGALADGFDGVLFIDHDITFRAEDVSTLIQTAHDEQAVVGALYGMRSGGSGRIIGEFAPEVGEATLFTGGGLYPATHVGMGFTAIPRHVFDAVTRQFRLPEILCSFTEHKVRPWFSLDLHDGVYWGEDVSFCWRAKEALQRVLIDTRIRVGHLGGYEYGVEDGFSQVAWAESLVAKNQIRPLLQSTDVD